MSIKYFDRNGLVTNQRGDVLDISSDTFSDKSKDNCVTISGRFNEVFQITGITVHDIVRSVLTNSTPKVKLAVRDWLTRQIEEENQ